MEIIVGLAIAGSVIGAIALAGKLLASRLTVRALGGGHTAGWKVACAASTLFSWAISLLAVEWLLVLACIAWSGTRPGEVLLTVIAGGLVVWYMTDRLPRIRQTYWRAIHDTLGDAVGLTSDAQRRSFNVDHFVILNGGEAAKLALARILATK